MILKDPFIIGPRLLPALRVGDAFISLGYSTRPGDESRTRYEWYVDIFGLEEYEGDDLQSGNWRDANLQSGFESLLCFLGACAESVNYARRNNLPFHDTEHADMFPRPVAEWAAAHEDELSSLQCWIEEEEGLIDED